MAQKMGVFHWVAILLIGGYAAFCALQLPDKVTLNHEPGSTISGFSGMNFSEPTDEPKLTVRDIYRLLKDRYESTVEDCSSLNIDYQLVSIENANMLSLQTTVKNPKITIDNHMNATPAYVVSLQDVKRYSFGSDEVFISTMVIFLNANTGEELLITNYP